MGLREKVTLILVIIIFIQIACGHCMPGTPRTASLKHYLNNLKPVKNNPTPTPYSPSRAINTPKQTFGKKGQNAKIRQNAPPKKSMYKAYNFPENEYPLDTSPRDSFYFGMNNNFNYQVNTPQKESRNLQYSAINDLKKEMKMKRKLSSIKQSNTNNYQAKREMSSTKFSSITDSIRLLDSGTFPEVQYPLNTMETWVPNYWNYLPFTQEQKQSGFGQQTFNPKFKEESVKPFTRMTKAKASEFLKPFDKLKEEQRHASTENSKRSNLGGTGLNFTKTATSERVSDDFISASLVSNIASNTSDSNKILKFNTENVTSLENTCPVAEYPNEFVPIPYKVIEQDPDIFCPDFELNNNTKVNNMNNSKTVPTANPKTLTPVQAKSSSDDTSSIVPAGSLSTEKDKSDLSDIAAIEDKPPTCTIFPTDELSMPVSNDNPASLLPDNMPSLTAEEIPDDTATVAGPLNVRMPLPYGKPIPNISRTSIPTSFQTNAAPLSNVNTVPGSSTSIIIIPINNSVGKSQSQFLKTNGDSPIIVYITTPQGSDSLSQTLPCNQYVSSPFGNSNHHLSSTISDSVPLLNDNPSSTALVNDIITNVSNSGSPLSMFETLPTNSMCYNNDNSPSLLGQTPFSKNNTFSDTPRSITPSFNDFCDQLPFSKDPTETCSFETFPSIPNSELPLYNFPDSDLSVLSDESYNNTNELPIIAREVIPEQEVTNISFSDIGIKNHVLETTLSQISNDGLTTDMKLPHKISTEDLEILDPLTDQLSIPVGKILIAPILVSETPENNLPLSIEKTIVPSSVSETITDSLPLPIDKTLPSNLLIDEPNNRRPLPTHKILASKPVSVTPNDSIPLPIDKTILLYPLVDKPFERLLLPMDKNPVPTAFSEIPADLLPLSVDTILFPTPISDHSENGASLIIHKTLASKTVPDTPTDSSTLPIYNILPSILPTNTPDIPLIINKTLPDPTQVSEKSDSLPQQKDLTHPPTPTSKNSNGSPLLPTDKPLPPDIIQHISTDLPQHKDETVLPTLVSETPSDNLMLLINSMNASTPLPVPEKPLTTDLSLTTTTLNTTREILPEPIDKTLQYPLLTSTSDCMPVPKERTLSPTPGSEILIDSLSLPLDNKPTEFSETPTEILPLTMDNSLSPMDPKLAVTSDFEALNDNQPNDLPLVVDEKVLSTSLNDNSNNDLPHLIDDFPMPVDEMISTPLYNLPVSDGLMDDLTFPIFKENPDTSHLTNPSEDMSPQKIGLPLSVDKLFRDTSLGNTFTDGQSLPMADSLMRVDKVFPQPAKDYIEINSVNYSPLSDTTTDDISIDKAFPESLLPDRTSDVLPKPLDKSLPEISLSDIINDGLQLPIDKTLSVSTNIPGDLSLSRNKTPSASKLQVTKALLENLLSLLAKEDFSSPIVKALPVTQPSPLHDAPAKSPLADMTEMSPPLLEEKGLSELPLSEIISDKWLMNLEESPQGSSPSIVTSDNLSIPIHDAFPKSPLSNTITENLMILDETLPESARPDITNDVLQLPKRSKAHSASKLPITKALLEYLLSVLAKEDFSSPIVKALPVTRPSPLHKARAKSLLADMTKMSSPLSREKGLSELPLSEINSDNWLTHLDESPQGSPPSIMTSDNLPNPSHDALPQSPLSPIITDDLLMILDEMLPQSARSEITSDDLPLPTDTILPIRGDTLDDFSLSRSKVNSASKLPITKALLENVLLDITKGDFSLPIAKALPVKPLSPLDKALSETPLSDMTKNSFVPETLPTNKILYDPENLTDDVKEEHQNGTLLSDNPTDLPLPMDIILTLINDTPDDFPLQKSKVFPSSKLPINKALLENVLSDITKQGFLLPVAKALRDSQMFKKPSNDLSTAKILHNDSLSDELTLLKDSNLVENILPAIIKDRAVFSKDKMLQNNPPTNTFTDSLLLSMDEKLPEEIVVSKEDSGLEADKGI